MAEHQYIPRELSALKGIKMRQVSACGFHTAVRRRGREGGRAGGSDGAEDGGEDGRNDAWI